jgi:hypothetical protein
LAEAGSGAAPEVTVCVRGDATIPCAITGPGGTFALFTLPADQSVTLEFTVPGFIPILAPIVTGSAPMDATMYPLPLFPAGGDPGIGVTPDWQDKGAVRPFVIGPDGGAPLGDPVVAATLNPADGLGPFFEDDTHTIVASASTFIDPYAWYYNVDPGTYNVTYSASMQSCNPVFPFPEWGEQSPLPQSIQIPVVAGYLTVPVGVECDPTVSGAPDSGAQCVPQTCAGLGVECGANSDGCGGVLECGTCDGSAFCGGGGPNRCGP